MNARVVGRNSLRPYGRATSYSTCLAVAVEGVPQRGVVHSVFQAAANIVFPGGLVLSLNAADSTRMPNGLQLSTPAGAFPFSVLRVGMPVLLGAQRLHIEAANCSLDLSNCTQWNPHIERPEQLDMEIVEKNGMRLTEYVASWCPTPVTPGATLAVAPTIYGLAGRSSYSRGDPCGRPGFTPGRPGPYVRAYGACPSFAQRPAWDCTQVRSMAQYLCGRGPGLTPTGDDILAGWLAINWLLHGPTPSFLAASQQIITVAKRQTHLLSQCWLGYAVEGNVALPIRSLLEAMTQEDDIQLAGATQTVLSMGATSGYDVIQGILLGLFRQTTV